MFVGNEVYLDPFDDTTPKNTQGKQRKHACLARVGISWFETENNDFSSPEMAVFIQNLTV